LQKFVVYITKKIRKNLTTLLQSQKSLFKENGGCFFVEISEKVELLHLTTLLQILGFSSYILLHLTTNLH